MKSRNTAVITTAIAGVASGFFLAVAGASPAGADPADPLVPPAPAPLLPAAAPDQAPVPGPGPEVDVQAAAAPDLTTVPPNGIPHLASPDALPPGSTMDPNAAGADSPNVSYFRDLWQAVQNHEISRKEALVMGFAQRGMNTPIPAQAPGPNVPTTPGSPPQAPPAPVNPLLPPPDAVAGPTGG